MIALLVEGDHGVVGWVDQVMGKFPLRDSYSALDM